MKASSRDAMFSSNWLTDKTRAVIGEMILAGLPHVYMREAVIGQKRERNVVRVQAAVSLGGALRDIQKTAAKETSDFGARKRKKK